MMRINRNSKGFTLIELLIVVAIIGILAAIAIPAYTGYTTKAKVAGVVHAMGAIKNAIAAYYTESGAYPAAATAAIINTTYGVDVPTQYATFAVVASTGTGRVEATIQGLSTDTNGTLLILTPNWAAKTWDWNSSTIPASYRPKG